MSQTGISWHSHSTQHSLETETFVVCYHEIVINFEMFQSNPKAVSYVILIPVYGWLASLILMGPQEP